MQRALLLSGQRAVQEAVKCGGAGDASFRSAIRSYFSRLLYVVGSRILAVRAVDGVPAVQALRRKL